MRDFKKLDIWKRSYQLTLKIYQISLGFPKTEMFGLTSQMRRASSSIPANIAEGCGRESDVEFKRYLTIAYGSANELETFTMLSKDLNYVNIELFQEIENEIIEIRKMIYSMIKHVVRGTVT